jgi:hypothetical protein
MRRRYIYRDGKFVELTSTPERELHYVQGDTMEPTRHPVDGKIYDSKSAFRRVTKATGRQEVGNEEIKDTRQPKKNKKEFVRFAQEVIDRGPMQESDFNNFIGALKEKRF